MIKENVLIVCFELKDFKKINDLDLTKYDKLILASDDIRVHEKCKKLEKIDKVTFLQIEIPYTKVAYDVLEIIKKINLFFLNFSKKYKIFNFKILEWPYHVEGGRDTQKIQDLLLYIESISNIISENNIKKVFIIDNPKYSLISKVLEIYCSTNSILYKKIIGKLCFFNINIKEIIRPLYYLFTTVYNKLLNNKNKPVLDEKLALILLPISSQHIINYFRFESSLIKKAGYAPLFFSWRINKVKVENNETNIQKIEQYVSWKDILISIIKVLQILMLRKKIFSEFLDYNLFYKNINLSKIISPYVFYHMIVDAPDYYRFYCGFKNFSKSLNIKLIRGNLSFNKYGNIVENILPIIDISKYTISVFLPVIDIYNDYRMKQYLEIYWKKFYCFVQNKAEKNILLKKINIESEKVIICGSIKAYKKFNFSKETILRKYNIKPTYNYFVLIDYPSSLFGYQSISEISKVIICILEKFKNSQDVCLLVKPHPSADLTLYNILNKKYNFENIYFLKKNDNIDELLFVSDVLISKYSTLGFEAIKYETLVISPQLCQSDAFKLYGDFGIYKYSIEDLSAFLDELFSNKEVFLKHKEEFVTKAKRYINEFFIPFNESLIINTLKNLY